MGCRPLFLSQANQRLNVLQKVVVQRACSLASTYDLNAFICLHDIQAAGNQSPTFLDPQSLQNHIYFVQNKTCMLKCNLSHNLIPSTGGPKKKNCPRVTHGRGKCMGLFQGAAFPVLECAHHQKETSVGDHLLASTRVPFGLNRLTP